MIGTQPHSSASTRIGQLNYTTGQVGSSTYSATSQRIGSYDYTSIYRRPR
jgi:hypothetical protein